MDKGTCKLNTLGKEFFRPEETQPPAALTTARIELVERDFYRETMKFLVSRWLRDLLTISLLLLGAWAAFRAMKEEIHG